MDRRLEEVPMYINYVLRSIISAKTDMYRQTPSSFASVELIDFLIVWACAEERLRSKLLTRRNLGLPGPSPGTKHKNRIEDIDIIDSKNG